MSDILSERDGVLTNFAVSQGQLAELQLKVDSQRKMIERINNQSALLLAQNNQLQLLVVEPAEEVIPQIDDDNLVAIPPAEELYTKFS